MKHLVFIALVLSGCALDIQPVEQTTTSSTPITTIDADPTHDAWPLLPPQAPFMMIAEGMWQTHHDALLSTTCGQLTANVDPLTFESEFVDPYTVLITPQNGVQFECGISNGATFGCDVSTHSFMVDDATFTVTTHRDGTIIDRKTVDATLAYSLTCTGTCADVAANFGIEFPCEIGYEGDFTLIE